MGTSRVIEFFVEKIVNKLSKSSNKFVPNLLNYRYSNKDALKIRLNIEFTQQLKVHG